SWAIPSRRSAIVGAPKARFGSKRSGPTTISLRSACLIPALAFRLSASKWDSFLYPPASPTDLALGYRYVSRLWRRMGAGFGWNHIPTAHPAALGYRSQNSRGPGIV